MAERQFCKLHNLRYEKPPATSFFDSLCIREDRSSLGSTVALATSIFLNISPTITGMHGAAGEGQPAAAKAPSFS